MDGSQSMVLNIETCIGEKDHHHKFVFESEDDVGKVISYVIALLKTNFVNASVEKQLVWKVLSKEKEEVIHQYTNMLVQTLSGEGEPCGSFALAYICMCDFFKQPSNQCEEVCWDINKIYASHRCKEFKLDDFDHLDTKDLIPLITALSYNTWFTRLTVSSTKLSNEVVDAIIKVIRRSLSIQDFVLVDCHLNKDQVQKLGLVLGANPSKVFKGLDFSRNNLEDKGVATITGVFSCLNDGLESLNLSEVGMTSKGAVYMANCLKNNKFMATTLASLNLSGNPLKSEGIQVLCDFFSQPNALQVLVLSNTECPLDLLFSALHRGCQLTLQDVNLSGNPFSTKKSKDCQMLSSFQQFFSMSRAIKSVNLSNTKIPACGVKAILVGLLNNPTLSGVALDLSQNELKSSGAAELSSCLKEISFSRLNLANNGLEQDLIQICDALQYNHFIEELDLGHNVTKTKNTNAIAEALAEIVVSESALKKLSIADCKLRNDASILFDCLGTNETLTSIDISGNAVGDVGARLLAKALQINTKLREIHLDHNNITAKGLQAIAQAMERNYSLHSMPIPITDLAAAMKQNNSNLFNRAYTQIEQALIRNRLSVDSTPEQVYKVHQSLLMSSIDQYTLSTDEFVNQLKDCIYSLQNSPNENIQKQIKTAQTLISEADLFRQVLLELYADPDHSKILLEDMFDKVSQDVVNSVECVIKENIDKMLKSATNICPTALNREEHISNIKTELLKDSLAEKDAISRSIIQLGKSEIAYKLCESNLTTATSIAKQLEKLFVHALQSSFNDLNALVGSFSSESITKDSQKNEAIKDKKDEENEKVDDEENGKSESVTTDSLAADIVSELKKEFQQPQLVIDTADLIEDGQPPLSTPAAQLLNDISNTGDFDLNWEFGTDRKRLSSTFSRLSSEEDADFVFTHKNRLNTNTSYQRDGIEKKKKVSIKRRPTFYRDTEKSDFDIVEIPLELPTPEKNVQIEKDFSAVKPIPSINMETDLVDVENFEQQSESIAKKKNENIERSKSVDETDSYQEEERTSSISSVGSIASRSGSVLSRQSFSVDDGLNEQNYGRSRLPSAGAFDAVSTQSKQLSVSKNRIKPARGRRAPTRVSKLAHMTMEDSMYDVQVKESSQDVAKPRPKSEMIFKTENFEEEFRQRLVTVDTTKRNPPVRPTPPTKPDITAKPDLSNKVDALAKPERPERPKKGESDKMTETTPKEKKLKPPAGAFQLPALPNMLGGLLKKRASPKQPDSVDGNASVNDSGAHSDLGNDEGIDSNGNKEGIHCRGTVSKDESVSNVISAPAKPPPPSVMKKVVSPSLEEQQLLEPTVSEAGDSCETPPSKPKPMVPRGIPIGGSALMAEMNKKLNKTAKTDEEESSKPKPETPAKPQKLTPPQRPPSLKKLVSIDGRPNVPDRPKLVQLRSVSDQPDVFETKDSLTPENLSGDVEGYPEESTSSLNVAPPPVNQSKLSNCSSEEIEPQAEIKNLLPGNKIEKEGGSSKEPFTEYI